MTAIPLTDHEYKVLAERTASDDRALAEMAASPRVDGPSDLLRNALQIIACGNCVGELVEEAGCFRYTVGEVRDIKEKITAALALIEPPRTPRTLASDMSEDR